jgi:hypothetical protein
MHSRSVWLVVVVLAGSSSVAHANPVITEVAWAGDPVSNLSTDEWIEIENPDGQPITLSDFTLIGAGTGAAALSLPATDLADGAYFIVENTAGVPTSDAVHSLVTSSISLTDTGEALCLCASTATSCADPSCDVANIGGAWFAGKATAGARKTMERKDPALPGGSASSWQDGSPSSPLAPSPAAPPPSDAGTVVDAGTASDAGTIDEPDAGPNSAPTVSVSSPSGAVNDVVTSVVYSAADADLGDAVSVDLFWSEAASGNAGVLFAQGLPGGANQAHDFDTTGLPPGTVHVFARARDTRGAEAFAYAPGTVDIGGAGPAVASFALTEPNGVNDVAADGSVAITWDVALPDGDDGTIALFADTDDHGADGVPIAGGLAAGAGGPRAFKWSPVPAGTHFVYGVLTHSGGAVTAYAPASVSGTDAGACSCTETHESTRRGLLAGLSLAILAHRLVRRRA